MGPTYAQNGFRAGGGIVFFAHFVFFGRRRILQETVCVKGWAKDVAQQFFVL